MKCVVLAAGEGKRMHPLTYTRPKVMLPVCNKPLLEWNLENTKKAGINEFVFIIAYKSEMVRNYFTDGSPWNVSIEYVNQGKALGTAHAIGTVEKFVDDFLVISGDTIFGSNDIKKMIKTPQSMGLVEVNNASAYGIVECKDNQVKKIYEKMTDPFTNIINAGIYHFSPSIFTYIKKTPKSARGEYEITDSINMHAQSETIKAVDLQEWRDVVYPWHLLDITEDIMKHYHFENKGTLHNGSTISNNIAIGKGTQILPGSCIEGPVIIGENCKIGPNCYIRPYTCIGDNCHIGNACEVKNTIIFNNSNVPHQNYVGDSIIGEGCNLGAGTKVANLRLDKEPIHFISNDMRISSERRKLGAIIGDNVQTGINSSINIGSNIGNHVIIGPGRVINGEIKPNTYLI
ncbi:MAG: NTP transferase domain-containing protein [Candidatus Thermoplasmatota archaeon]|nr:NTP transferase domain-containing protein [Candidatus Thermoplasmatota archaeon]